MISSAEIAFLSLNFLWENFQKSA